MILSMQKVRILGPRSRLDSVIATLHDFGILHLSAPALDPPVVPLRPDPRRTRHVARIEAALGEVEEAIALLGCDSSEASDAQTPIESLAREVRLARRAKRAVARTIGLERALLDERGRLVRLERAVEAFARMGVPGSASATRTFYVVLTASAGDSEARLSELVADAVGPGFTLHAEPLAEGETAAALVVPRAEAERVEALLTEAGVREVERADLLEGVDLASGLASLRRRLVELDQERARLAARREHLAVWLRPGLLRARRSFHDFLAADEALGMAATTAHLFILEGWLPVSERAALGAMLAEREGDDVVVEDIARENWSARDVPVAIRNPRIFRPFELITQRLPLPRYGTMDPTPFVAVFFPMFFGLILGDVGYGAILGALALIGWLRSSGDGLLRAISEIAGACAVFSVLFGLLFGELLGDLGHRLFGMRAIAFSRDRAFVPFLLLSVSIGFIHVVLGLILGALSSLRSDPRESIGRGLAAVMLVLTAVLLLVVVNVLPARFFTPMAVSLIVLFPVLVAVEGMIGAVELMSRLSNILSYARIMALGTASVMLAMVANELVGSVGGVLIGVIFATLFHLVNFALGVFSPTVHALRLHFVEFFGTFYSPGGQRYRPFRHWRPADVPEPSRA